jgi:hypothetical protein
MSKVTMGLETLDKMGLGNFIIGSIAIYFLENLFSLGGKVKKLQKAKN